MAPAAPEPLTLTIGQRAATEVSTDGISSRVRPSESPA